MEKLSLLWLWQRVKEPVDLRWVLCVARSSTPSPVGFGTPDFRWAHCQNKKLLFPASLAGKVLKTRFRSLRRKGKYHVGLEEFSLKGLGLLYFPPFPSRMDVAAATGVHGMETTCRGQRMAEEKDSCRFLATHGDIMSAPDWRLSLCFILYTHTFLLPLKLCYPGGVQVFVAVPGPN